MYNRNISLFWIGPFSKGLPVLDIVLYLLCKQNGKEEALLMLTTANNRADAIQSQLNAYEDTITALRREKQVLETELSVLRVSS